MVRSLRTYAPESRIYALSALMLHLMMCHWAVQYQAAGDLVDITFSPFTHKIAAYIETKSYMKIIEGSHISSSCMTPEEHRYYKSLGFDIKQ